jgi:hypothetical protein
MRKDSVRVCRFIKSYLFGFRILHDPMCNCPNTKTASLNTFLGNIR